MIYISFTCILPVFTLQKARYVKDSDLVVCDAVITVFCVYQTWKKRGIVV
jgi:hypothetical protein